jgi:hypothetical protein
MILSNYPPQVSVPQTSFSEKTDLQQSKHSKSSSNTSPSLAMFVAAGAPAVDTALDAEAAALLNLLDAEAKADDP